MKTYQAAEYKRLTGLALGIYHFLQDTNPKCLFGDGAPVSEGGHGLNKAANGSYSWTEYSMGSKHSMLLLVALELHGTPKAKGVSLKDKATGKVVQIPLPSNLLDTAVLLALSAPLPNPEYASGGSVANAMVPEMKRLFPSGK